MEFYLITLMTEYWKKLHAFMHFKTKWFAKSIILPTLQVTEESTIVGLVTGHKSTDI
ncbi:MAG: hypothetical protein R3250_15000 [Melioribacteraceae bacterium]|nr:hypothetical protein [Melioribacteraceae bacterium]